MTAEVQGAVVRRCPSRTQRASLPGRSAKFGKLHFSARSGWAPSAGTLPAHVAIALTEHLARVRLGIHVLARASSNVRRQVAPGGWGADAFFSRCPFLSNSTVRSVGTSQSSGARARLQGTKKRRPAIDIRSICQTFARRLAVFVRDGHALCSALHRAQQCAHREPNLH